MANLQMQARLFCGDIVFLTISKDISTFLRPRFTCVVVLDFSDFVVVLWHSADSFSHSLHCTVMKSPISSAVLALVIICCVHGRVSGKHRKRFCHLSLPPKRSMHNVWPLWLFCQWIIVMLWIFTWRLSCAWKRTFLTISAKLVSRTLYFRWDA